MISHNDIKSLVASANQRSKALQECHEALSGSFSDETRLGPGEMSARDAVDIFGIRRDTALAASADTCGLVETLEALTSLNENEPVLLFHFAFQEKIFTIFVGRETRTVLGCVRVRRSR
jgi:hypothetical protein